MEHRSLESGGPRIKFRCSREDPSPSSSSSSSDHQLASLRRALSDGLRELVRTKAAPLDLDGDFACVTSFDSEGWEATYQSSSESRLLTSS